MDFRPHDECLPTSHQTFLLQAALLQGERAREGWREWTNHASGDLIAGLRGKDRLWIKSLLPLLLLSVKRNNLPIDPAVRTFLKMVYAAEHARAEFCRRLGKEILETLSRNSVTPLVIRGFAFSETLYEESGLRHCHDIDLFIQPDECASAYVALSDLGFVQRTPKAADYTRFAHSSRLEVVVHERLFPEGIDVSAEECMNHRVSRIIAETPSSVLSPADAVAQLCVSAWGAGLRPSPIWICDMWFLLSRFHDSDWVQVRDLVRRGVFERVFDDTLGYIEQNLVAPSIGVSSAS